jgi:hypothetical protein
MEKGKASDKGKADTKSDKHKPSPHPKSEVEHDTKG